jgi:FAD/FMN-containing dehydrogenase
VNPILVFKLLVPTKTANPGKAATEILNPTCVFLPDTPQHVSRAVALFSRSDCKFAIRGGGHSALGGAANIDDGVLLATDMLNTLQVNLRENYIRVGAGNRLGAVYQALDQHNLCTVVGRFEKVGLGLALAAGMSYWSNREGLTVDNVVNYEIVLANGTIANANARSNPELFWALKGGNNNFGVVTHYHLRTFPTAGTAYGGYVYYPESSFDQLQDVFYDYHVRQASADILTHALPTYGYDGATDTASSGTQLYTTMLSTSFPQS